MGEPLPPLPLAMCDTYCRGILRVMVGQVLGKLEFDSVSAASRDTLTDILQAYIEELGHVSHNASELANRTEANAHDVLVAFDDCNLSLQDLRAYCDESDEIPLCHGHNPDLVHWNHRCCCSLCRSAPGSCPEASPPVP